MKPTCFGLALLCPWLALAQPRPLAVGDTLPLAQVAAAIDTVKYQQLATGSTIIDFWATWCTSCLKGIDKLMGLQKQFPQLQVLLVNAVSTGDTGSKIERFMSRQQARWGRPCPFPLINDDTVLAKLFPHQLLPHYVWLHNGIVKGITASEALSKTNVQAFLSGYLAGQLKTDLDAARPLFTASAYPLQGLQSYALCLRGYCPGYSTGNHIRRSGSVVRGHAFTNCSLLYIYTQLAKQLIPAFTKKQWLLTAADSLALAGESPGDLYNVDFILPPAQADSLYPNILQFLNTATGWKGESITRIQQVWVLAPVTGSTTQSPSATSRNSHRPVARAANKPSSTVADWLNYLSNQSSITCPVISTEDSHHSIKLALPAGIASVAGLKKTLAFAGWALTLQQRPVTMFRVTRQALHPPAASQAAVNGYSSKRE